MGPALNVSFAGAGKTMLMDLFFKSVHVEQKRRVHFNKFMRTVHDSKLLNKLEILPIRFITCFHWYQV